MRHEHSINAFGLATANPSADPALVRYALAVPEKPQWRHRAREIPVHLRRAMQLLRWPSYAVQRCRFACRVLPPNDPLSQRVLAILSICQTEARRPGAAAGLDHKASERRFHRPLGSKRKWPQSARRSDARPTQASPAKLRGFPVGKNREVVEKSASTACYLASPSALKSSDFYKSPNRAIRQLGGKPSETAIWQDEA